MIQSENYVHEDVHEELEGILKQSELNIAKFLAHDAELVRIDGFATAAGACVAAIITALGIARIINNSQTLDLNDLKSQVDSNTTHLNSLSTNSILSKNNLNSTSTTIFNNLNSLSMKTRKSENKKKK